MPRGHLQQPHSRACGSEAALRRLCSTAEAEAGVEGGDAGSGARLGLLRQGARVSTTKGRLQNQTSTSQCGRGPGLRGTRATRPVMFTTTGLPRLGDSSASPHPFPLPFISLPGAWFGDSGAWDLPPQPHPDRSKRVRKQKARRVEGAPFDLIWKAGWQAGGVPCR